MGCGRVADVCIIKRYGLIEEQLSNFDTTISDRKIICMEKLEMTEKKNRTISIILYITGTFFALLFAGSILWANLELPFYFDYSYASVGSENQTQANLDCPIILTTKETGIVKTEITNNTDKPLNPVLRGEVSYLGGIARDIEFNPAILPGESSPISIEVNSDDIVFNFMIFVRTFQLPTYKTPAQAGSCAMLMVPISFLSGDQVYILSLSAIFALLAAGIILWVKNNKPLRGMPRRAFNVMITLATLLLAAIFCGLTDGLMVPGFLLLVLIVLLIMVAIVYFLTSAEIKEN